MTTERRLHSRKTPSEFTFIQIEQEFGGRVLNYSKEGLSFETSAPICDSDLVQFWLSFRRHGQVDGVGRIAWLNEKRNLGGIAFVHLSRASRQKIDEWTDTISEQEAAVREHPAEDAGNTPKQESPEHVVSEIMERVLGERRKSPASVPTAFSQAMPATATASAAHVQDVEQPKAPETTSSAVSAATPTLAAITNKCLDSASEVEAETRPEREPGSSETSNSALPPVVTAAAGQTAALGSTTEAEETAPALDLPDLRADATAVHATSFGGVDSEAEPAVKDAAAALDPESPPAASSTEQTRASSDAEAPPEETKEVVPLTQYLYARRAEFLRGAAIGIASSAVIAIAIFTVWKPAERGALAEGTRNAVSANSIAAKENTAAVPVPASRPTEESNGSGSSQKEHNAFSAGKPSVVGSRPPVAGKTSRGAEGVASAPEQSSADGPANAVPRPNSFANRDSGTGNGFQPMFQPSPPGEPDGEPGNAEPWNGQSKVEVGLGSTPWTFRRRNIHGNPPVGGEVHPPELIAQVAPRYPELAKIQGVSGDVVIDAVIDSRGSVRQAQVVSGPAPLRAAAVSAVLLWKYKPAMLDGKPAEVHESITVKFRPQ